RRRQRHRLRKRYDRVPVCVADVAIGTRSPLDGFEVPGTRASGTRYLGVTTESPGAPNLALFLSCLLLSHLTPTHRRAPVSIIARSRSGRSSARSACSSRRSSRRI